MGWLSREAGGHSWQRLEGGAESASWQAKRQMHHSPCLLSLASSLAGTQHKCWNHAGSRPQRSEGQHSQGGGTVGAGGEGLRDMLL